MSMKTTTRRQRRETRALGWRLSWFLALVLVVSWVTPARVAGPYYVSTLGSNSNSCATSASLGASDQTKAKLTILAGLQCAAAGEFVNVYGGTYAESIDDNLVSVPTGTDPSRITVRNYNGGTVLMRPASGCYSVLAFSKTASRYLTFDGINMDGRPCNEAVIAMFSGYGGGNPHHLTVLNAELQGAEGALYTHSFGVIMASNSASSIGGNVFRNINFHGGGRNDADHHFYIMTPDNIVENSVLWDYAGSAWQVYSGDGGTPNNNILRNTLIHSKRAGVLGQPGNLPGRGVCLFAYTATSGTQIYNNICHTVPNSGGFTTGFDIDATNVSVWNNTVYGVSGSSCMRFAGSGHVAINNICYGNSNNSITGSVTKTTNLEGTNPRFVDGPNHDFHLLPDSPAIDAGTTVGSVPSDQQGAARPQGSAYDIGAYERVSGEVPSPTCTPKALPEAFTGADDTVLEAHDPCWEMPRGNFKIRSNGVAANTGGLAIDSVARWTGSTYTNNHRVKLDVIATTTGKFIGVGARCSATGGAYMTYTDGVAAYLVRILPGAAFGVRLLTVAGITAGQEIAVTASGNQIGMEANGVPVSGSPVTDTELTDGTPCVTAFDASNSTRGDNFDATDIASPGVPGGTPSPEQSFISLTLQP